MRCRKIKENEYCVEQLIVSSGEYKWKELFIFNSEEDGINYINEELDKLLRKDIIDPVSLDIIKEIGDRFNKGNRWNCYGRLEKQWTYATKDEYKRYVDEYFNKVMDGVWNRFSMRNIASEGIVNDVGIRALIFSEDNIDNYKDSIYYKSYKKDIENKIKEKLDIYIKESSKLIKIEHSKNRKETADNLAHNTSHSKKIPTLKSGLIAYIVIMFIEIIFFNTIQLWIFTTLIFLLWRHNEIRKYHGMYTREEMNKIDLWKRKF